MIRNFNEIVAEPLGDDNYKDWFEWVETYLIAQDLWEVTSTSARPDKDHVEDFERWRRKNAAALHAIRISCGPDNLSLIRGASEAKVAWDNLYHSYNAPPSPPKEHVDFEVAVLCKAICDSNWWAAKTFIDEHPSALSAPLNSEGDTALHLAAKFGHVGIVEELVRLASPQCLEIQDHAGFTSLATAIKCGGNDDDHTPLANAESYSRVIRIVKCMVNKNSNILGIPTTSRKWIPVTIAFEYGLKEVGLYLYSVTPLEVLRQPTKNGVPKGCMLITRCCDEGYFDIVLNLLQRCQELLFAVNSDGQSMIEYIAASHFPSGSQLVCWKRWIYHYIRIPSTAFTNHLQVDIQQEDKIQNIQAPGLIHGLISSTNNLLGMKEIYKLKLQHAQIAEILSLVCKNVILLEQTKKNIVAKTLATAARWGNIEFLLQVSKANPEPMSFRRSIGDVFFKAVEHRQAEVFNLIHRFCFKNEVTNIIQHSTGNNLLHIAAKLAPSSHLNRISGAALQMQSEMQWFKAVKDLAPSNLLAPNDDGMKPLDLFKKSHKHLRNEGEQWMKETASSCSVVGALIVTIMFAVAFTVPGGNDQISGYPIFLKEKLFIFFIISDTLSLFSSTTSVLTFLGILTSRHAEEDFLYSLPRKLIIGLSALFLSIATMMMAFSATIILMVQQRLHIWGFLPIILLASVPVTLFVLLQFPLLVQIITSTYAPMVFRKIGEKWP